MSGNMYEALVVIGVMLLVALVAYVIYRIYTHKKRRPYLEGLWGCVSDRRYSKNELADIKTKAAFLHDNVPFVVDDITWNDLDMDAVYMQANHTQTDAGDQMLYHMLRVPDQTKLQEKAEALRWLEAHPRERRNIVEALYGCGRLHNTDMALLLEGNPYGRWAHMPAVLLCVMLTVSIVLVFAGIAWAVIPFVALIAVNSLYSGKMNKKQRKYINTIGYMSTVAKCGYTIFSKYTLPGCDGERQRKLLEATVALRQSRALEMFYMEDSILLMLNRVFLLEAITFISVMGKIAGTGQELLELYRNVGRVDALCAVASYRASLPLHCEPVITQDNTAALHFEGLVHPLLKKPVPNSAKIGGNMLVTGSNATGKSTFLKMIAVNAILAQSICTSMAQSWYSPFFSVYTSMALRDNLFEDESYFVTEIKSIRRMLYSRSDNVRLCVVDEILRGTNTGERIAASSEVLLRFAGENCLCVAATHDLELSFILENDYKNMHFTERIEAGEMHFDYKLHEGRSQSRNAIKLLEILGYDGVLVRAAEQRFDMFSKTGQWYKKGKGK